MNNKTNLAIVIAAVIAIGGYLLWSSPAEAPTPEVGTAPVVATNPVPSATVPVVANPNLINYTDEGYSPNLLIIKKGETVIFQNSSAKPTWPASAMHPTHKVYPTTGGCLGSTFDACRGLKTGETWSFQFDVAGTWGYHDHLNAKHFGKIVVQ